MAGRKIENTSIGAADWTSEVESKNLLKKGWYSLSFTNMDNTSAPAIAAGSSVDIDGVIYAFDGEEAISGSASDGMNFIKITGGATATASYSQTTPTWNSDKLGWYDGTDRVVLGFVCSEFGSYSFYEQKFEYRDYEIKNLIVEKSTGYIFTDAFTSTSSLNPDRKVVWNNTTKTFEIVDEIVERTNPVRISYNSRFSSASVSDTIFYGPYNTYGNCEICINAAFGATYYTINHSNSKVAFSLYAHNQQITTGASKPTGPADGNIHIQSGAVEVYAPRYFSPDGWSGDLVTSGVGVVRYFNNSRPGSPLVGDVNFLTTNCEICANAAFGGTWFNINSSDTENYIIKYIGNQNFTTGTKPSDKQEGDIHIQSGVIEVWDGSNWVIIYS